MSYVKIDSGILDSTIWSEPPEVVKVWMTMLVMADAGGMVAATAPGIARRAILPLATVVAALELFEGPDEHSRTPDNDGRRIRRVSGGYLILNYLAYREKDHTAAERARRWRDRRKSNNDGERTPLRNGDTRDVTQAEAEAEADTPVRPSAGARETDASGREGEEDIAEAQALCTSELLAYSDASGLPPDQALAKYSRTRNGSTITRIDTCPRPSWLRTTADRLRGARLAIEAEHHEREIAQRPPPVEVELPDPTDDALEVARVTGEALVARTSLHTCATWWRGLRPLRVVGHTLVVVAPSSDFRASAVRILGPHLRAIEAAGAWAVRIVIPPEVRGINGAADAPSEVARAPG